MTDRKASSTSLTGQDGSHLADLLLQEECVAHRLTRRASRLNTHCTEHRDTDPQHEYEHLSPHCADQADGSRPVTLMERLHSDGVSHHAARLPMRISLDEPELIGHMAGPGTASLPRQRDGAPCCPRSPCSAQKVHAYRMTRNCREASGLFAVNGILSGRESPAAGRRS